MGVEHVEVVPRWTDPVGFVREVGEKVVPRLAEL